MNINQWVECPYCGTGNAVRYEVDGVNYTVRQVVTCDIDAGGCDRLFVVGYTLVIKVSILKIEGEMEKYDPADAAEAAMQAWAEEGERIAAEIEDAQADIREGYI